MHAGMIASLAIAVALYAAGFANLWHKGRRRRARLRRAAAFAIGWLVLATALLSPLHEMTEQLFSAHMVQHELLMVVAAPLLVLADRSSPCCGRCRGLGDKPLDAWRTGGQLARS
jgi:cytochrome c oxidase assembly factor CtaG